METHNIQFNNDELNIVFLGLQKLPWETANTVIQSIMKQLQPKPNKAKKDVDKSD